MKIFLGYDYWALKKQNKKIPIVIDYKKTINPHAIITGDTGSGKTFLLKHMIYYLTRNNPNIRIHVIDSHGDIRIPGESYIKFSETEPVGLQPLKISADPDFGGVRKKVNSFIEIINRNSTRKMGDIQIATLENILYDLFARNDFYPDNPRSWNVNHSTRDLKYKKKYPTLDDLYRFVAYKLKEQAFGINWSVLNQINELERQLSQLKKKFKQEAKAAYDEEVEKIKANIVVLKEKIKQTFSTVIDGMETGNEIDDFFKYESQDTLKSIFLRIQNLKNTGIFKATEPNFDINKPVWRYDIKSLSISEKRMFVDFLFEDIFLRKKEQGIQQIPNEFIVLDEASIYVQDIDDDHIIKVIEREARKFGLGLIMATQSLEHFPSDVIQSSATKILLGVDVTMVEKTARKLQIKKEEIKYIIPKQRGIIQIKTSGNIQANAFKAIQWELTDVDKLFEKSIKKSGSTISQTQIKESNNTIQQNQNDLIDCPQTISEYSENPFVAEKNTAQHIERKESDNNSTKDRSNIDIDLSDIEIEDEF